MKRLGVRGRLSLRVLSHGRHSVSAHASFNNRIPGKIRPFLTLCLNLKIKSEKATFVVLLLSRLYFELESIPCFTSFVLLLLLLNFSSFLKQFEAFRIFWGLETIFEYFFEF